MLLLLLLVRHLPLLYPLPLADGADTAIYPMEHQHPSTSCAADTPVLVLPPRCCCCWLAIDPPLLIWTDIRAKRAKDVAWIRRRT